MFIRRLNHVPVLFCSWLKVFSAVNRNSRIPRFKSDFWLKIDYCPIYRQIIKLASWRVTSSNRNQDWKTGFINLRWRKTTLGCGTLELYRSSDTPLVDIVHCIKFTELNVNNIDLIDHFSWSTPYFHLVNCNFASIRFHTEKEGKNLLQNSKLNP